MGVYAKQSRGQPQTSFVFMPSGRVRRREILCVIPKKRETAINAVPQKKIPNYIDSLSSAMRFSTCSAFC